MNYNMWYISPDDQTGKLISPYKIHPDGNEPDAILTAQPFTVSLKTIRITENHHKSLFEQVFRQDGVLILSSNSLGTKPEVQRVHYYQDYLPPGTLVDNFLSDTIFLCDDYSGKERLWLEFHVLGVGIPPEERDALVSKFTSLAETAGAIFPVTLPYSFIASSIAGTVDKMINAIQKDKQLLNQRVSFYPHHPKDPSQPTATVDHNTPLLRQGTYVVFAETVDGSAYSLQEDGSVSPNPNVSYVVFSVDQDNAPSPDWVNSQRVAMLLTHLRDGNPNAEQAPIEFLMSTLTGYSNFNKLQRYQDLWEKKQKGSLAPAEQALMDQIAAIPELKPFLQT